MQKCLIKYFQSLGIEVHTGTKARGHQGLYTNNRIDISKNIKAERIIPTLLHEFAHYIHSKIEPNMMKTGGSFEVLFLDSNPIIKEELTKVTQFVDTNSRCEKLLLHKKAIQLKIKQLDELIKNDYPNFKRSKKFKEFEKYIKNSKAKYLMKYDRIKLITGFFNKKVELYSINNLEKDFTDMPIAFANYIRLHSYQKKQSRISARINKYKKYYERPTELFARFVEGLYIDKEKVHKIAPYTYQKFYTLLQKGHYKELANVIN